MPNTECVPQQVGEKRILHSASGVSRPMRIIHTASTLEAGHRPVCLAIGFFDGVHLGHQQIIRQTLADARQQEALALVVTFDRHPNVVVAPRRVPPLIYSLSQKLRAIEALGPDSLLLLEFDKAFSQQSGEDFIRRLAIELGRIHSLCVGASFTFGHKRSGDVALLRKLGDELHFRVHGLAAVSLAGKVISSTRIREVIQAGDLNLAGQMLGRPYSLAARVVAGDGLGRQLGFPTANLEATGLALPSTGVYAAQVLWRGQTFRAVVNVGRRPTLQIPDPPLRVEAHVLGLDAELHGEEMEVVFGEKLREEKKFASVAELKEQIARDVDRVRSTA
jgi:riboflavin kinase/FMN adenylyltransferase